LTSLSCLGGVDRDTRVGTVSPPLAGDLALRLHLRIPVTLCTFVACNRAFGVRGMGNCGSRSLGFGAIGRQCGAFRDTIIARR